MKNIVAIWVSTHDMIRLNHVNTSSQTNSPDHFFMVAHSKIFSTDLFGEQLYPNAMNQCTYLCEPVPRNYHAQSWEYKLLEAHPMQSFFHYWEEEGGGERASSFIKFLTAFFNIKGILYTFNCALPRKRGSVTFQGCWPTTLQSVWCHHFVHFSMKAWPCYSIQQPFLPTFSKAVEGVELGGYIWQKSVIITKKLQAGLLKDSWLLEYSLYTYVVLGFFF